MGPHLLFVAVFAACALAATLLRGGAPRLSLALWLAPIPAHLVVYWSAPGAPAVLIGMPLLLFPLKARAARREAPGLSAPRFLALVLNPLAPLPSQRRPAPGFDAAAARLARGLLLLATAVLLLRLGLDMELWRRSLWLEDLYVMAEVAVLFTALMDVTLASLWLAGLPVPDYHDGGFVGARSLRAFWRRWNGAVSGILDAGLFRPIARERRRLVLGFLAAFGASGLLHALPLLVATEDRALNAVMMAAAFAFFALHALGVLIEGRLPGRWRHSWRGLAWVYGFFAATAWAYPSTMGVVINLHRRPPAALTYARALSWLTS